jgi:aryl-alcohol dehydrogenase-like predicted oxidoreductase
MEYRFLGRSGLRVSALGFGGLTLGGKGFWGAHGSTSESDAEKIVGMAVDAGVTLFDTADNYSLGESERILGKALGKKRRDVVIATKVFQRMGEGPNDAGLSRGHIVESCENSLRRLGVDYIDLYQSHGPDALTPLDETLRAFDHLVQSGKVRYIGSCNHSGWQQMKALATSSEFGLTRHVSQQVMYSLMCRDAERELVPLGLDQGVGMLVFSPLAAGLLSGKYRRDAPLPEGTRVTELGLSDYAPYAELERLYQVVDVLDQLSAAHRATPAQIALAWVLKKPCVTSAIFGARNEAQLRDNLQAADIDLSPGDVAALDAASDTPAPYPYWHQRKYSAERNPTSPTYRPPMPGEQVGPPDGWSRAD